MRGLMEAVTRIDDLLLVSFRKVLLLNRELEVGIERRLNFGEC